LAGASFAAPKATEAGSAALDPALDLSGGPGWLACGDAALAFDPLSQQGLLSALHGGLDAARAAHSRLRGDPAPAAAYAARLAEIRRIHLGRLRAAYRDAAWRWPDAPFWTVMAGAPAVAYETGT